MDDKTSAQNNTLNIESLLEAYKQLECDSSELVDFTKSTADVIRETKVLGSDYAVSFINATHTYGESDASDFVDGINKLLSGAAEIYHETGILYSSECINRLMQKICQHDESSAYSEVCDLVIDLAREDLQKTTVSSDVKMVDTESKSCKLLDTLTNIFEYDSAADAVNDALHLLETFRESNLPQLYCTDLMKVMHDYSEWDDMESFDALIEHITEIRDEQKAIPSVQYIKQIAKKLYEIDDEMSTRDMAETIYQILSADNTQHHTNAIKEFSGSMSTLDMAAAYAKNCDEDTIESLTLAKDTIKRAREIEIPIDYITNLMGVLSERYELSVQDMKTQVHQFMDSLERINKTKNGIPSIQYLQSVFRRIDDDSEEAKLEKICSATITAIENDTCNISPINAPVQPIEKIVEIYVNKEVPVDIAEKPLHRVVYGLGLSFMYSGLAAMTGTFSMSECLPVGAGLAMGAHHRIAGPLVAASIAFTPDIYNGFDEISALKGLAFLASTVVGSLIGMGTTKDK